MPESLNWKRRDIEFSKQKYFRQFEVKRDIARARVIEVDGDVESEFKPGYAHVLIYGVQEGGHTTARIGGAQIVADMPVLVARDPANPFEWQILGAFLDEVMPDASVVITRYKVENHALNHQWPTEANVGPDPVKVFQPAMQQLKTTGDGSTLTITIQPLTYVVSGVRRNFLGTTHDLTSSVPGAGLTRRVLVYLNESTNLITILEGTTVASGGAIPVPYPTIPDGARASAYVQLTNGQTAITTATHIDDARDFLVPGSGSSGSLPVATSPGQIIISDEGNNWIAVTPMVDGNGDIMTDENDLIMYNG
jgi:hypothetical protein